MIFFYNILVTRKLPSVVLTYSYELELIVGSVVEVQLQNKNIYGVVVLINNNQDVILNPDKIKPIITVFPVVLSQHTLDFLNIFALNTFNSKNLVLSSILMPLGLLIKKDLISLKEKVIEKEEMDNLSKKTEEIKIYNENNILFRIRYIIRNTISFS